MARPLTISAGAMSASSTNAEAEIAPMIDKDPIVSEMPVSIEETMFPRSSFAAPTMVDRIMRLGDNFTPTKRDHPRNAGRKTRVMSDNDEGAPPVRRFLSEYFKYLVSC
jgi:hypothetical protein